MESEVAAARQAVDLFMDDGVRGRRFSTYQGRGTRGRRGVGRTGPFSMRSHRERSGFQGGQASAEGQAEVMNVVVDENYRV